MIEIGKETEGDFFWIENHKHVSYDSFEGIKSVLFWHLYLSSVIYDLQKLITLIKKWRINLFPLLKKGQLVKYDHTWLLTIHFLLTICWMLFYRVKQ